MAFARTISTGTLRPLEGEWAVASVTPDRATHPADLEAISPAWISCDGPMPAAAALRAVGEWDLDRPRDFDADDWWYRCRFSTADRSIPARLHFEGLASVADAWLNGRLILRSESMFVAHVVDVSDALEAENELVLRFHALKPILAARRGARSQEPGVRSRPKWRTRLVDDQQLRWHRTSLLGRMPGWCPSVAPVGPWRPILLESAAPLLIEQLNVRTELAGEVGVLNLHLAMKGAGPQLGTRGKLRVGEWIFPVAIEHASAERTTLRTTVRVPDVRRWWPHTHGEPQLYPVRLSIEGEAAPVDIDLGRIGFRTLQIDRGADGEGFGLIVNDVPVFCRGACWTPLDIARLDAEEPACRAALDQLRSAGMNMVRVPGTMVYEGDMFHDLCDELGLLVWQDFMFANMDYPGSDPVFADLVAIEARQVLQRLQGHPSTAVVCGSSEIEQQVAMLGLPSQLAANPLFNELLPQLVAAFLPDVAWVRSTPTGGTLPFQADRGVTHYYGVGAYLRPFEDARRAGVRFASECLAFSNVPDGVMLDSLLGGGAAAGHHPRWKVGVPRDNGSGWDFEDVRDHYVRLLFGVDPIDLRARQPERYLALGRVATGEAMQRTFSEWRRPGSSCRGGLVWFARDLRPGAGWGVIDSTGRPKPAYWYLRRALAPVTLLALDEGLNGLWLHAVNDTSEPIEAEIRVALYAGGRPRGVRATTALSIPARGFRSIHADALFDGFLDLTYAYRFGPPEHDVVAATLWNSATGAQLAAAHCFPCGLPAACDQTLALAARVESLGDGYLLNIQAAGFAHAVNIEAEGFVPEDNYFHLEPGETRRVKLRAERPGTRLRGTVAALNGTQVVSIGPLALAGGAHG